MVKFYMCKSGVLNELSNFEDGCWVHSTAPTCEEQSYLKKALDIPDHFLLAALDEEEKSRIDREGECTLIIVDTPICTSTESGNEYYTMPLGIIVTPKSVVTISAENTALYKTIISNGGKLCDSKKRRRFVLELLYNNAALFLANLRQAEKEGTFAERELKKNAGNKELLRILHIEKGLVYFSTGLKSDEAVLEKLLRTNFISDYPEDAELLEDVIVENRQAIEMCAIYRDILSRTMEAYSGVISKGISQILCKLQTVA